MKKIFLIIMLSGLTGLYAKTPQATVGAPEQSKKFTNLSQAQQDSLILAFPQFMPGTVIFKNMSQAKADVNYNYHNQQFLFKENGEIKKMDNLKDVVMITVGKQVFIPLSKGLGQILIDDEVCLVESRKINVQEVKTGAYGSGGSTASISNLQSVDGTSSNTGVFTSHQTFSTNAIFVIDTRFFLMKDMELYVATKKNFLKCFPKCTAFIEQYIAENKPDYTDEAQMRTFVALCNVKEKEAGAKK